VRLHVQVQPGTWVLTLDARLTRDDTFYEANSEGEGNPVCSPHGITTDQRGVLPSLPWYDTAGHATEPIGLFPHM